MKVYFIAVMKTFFLLFVTISSEQFINSTFYYVLLNVKGNLVPVLCFSDTRKTKSFEKNKVKRVTIKCLVYNGN